MNPLRLPTCGMIILAAGASRRMGRPKQMLEFEGQTLLRRAVTTAVDSVCRPIVVVLGANADLMKVHLHGQPVMIADNAQWTTGMGSSIRAGIALLQHADAAMIFLCDQPLVTTASLDRLVASHFQSGAPVTAASYAGATGTPAIFSASIFSELSQMDPAHGGRAVIQRYRDRLNVFPLLEAQMDVDTEEDFERLKRSTFENIS